MEITTEQLLAAIGAYEMEVRFLRQQNMDLQQQLGALLEADELKVGSNGQKAGSI